MSESTITWHDASIDLPDDEMTVLVALDDGEVWTGFIDAGVWRYVSADPIEATITHWAEFPSPPESTSPERAAPSASSYPQRDDRSGDLLTREEAQ